MIQTEKQLKKIIKETLILTETGIELDDVIASFQKDFEEQIQDNDNNKKNDAITTIRKNNVLLEIILYLIEKYEAKDFEKFYEKSGFLNNTSDKNKFLQEQDEKRQNDINSIKNYVSNFLKSLNSIDDNQGFIDSLNTLKNKLNDYIPEWYVLQYLFYNINTSKFKNILTSIANDESNFYNDEENSIKKYFIEENVFGGKMRGIVSSVALNINANKLEDEQKKEILSDTVRSSAFTEGIGEGDWDWLTDIIDDTVHFFFPELRSVTTEITKFFELAEKAAGGKEAMQKKLDNLMENVSVKKVLEGIGLGKIPSENELQKALDIMKQIKNQF